MITGFLARYEEAAQFVCSYGDGRICRRICKFYGGAMNYRSARIGDGSGNGRALRLAPQVGGLKEQSKKEKR
jgi:hypothetical protein